MTSASRTYPTLYGPDDTPAEIHVNLTDEGIVVDVYVDGDIVATTWMLADELADQAVPMAPIHYGED